MDLLSQLFLDSGVRVRCVLYLLQREVLFFEMQVFGEVDRSHTAKPDELHDPIAILQDGLRGQGGSQALFPPFVWGIGDATSVATISRSPLDDIRFAGGCQE
jgi:hypothetical protein